MAVPSCWVRLVAASAVARRRSILLIRSSYRYCSSCAANSNSNSNSNSSYSHSESDPKSNPAATKAPPDHRDLGLRQKLFTTSIYSPGSPIFLPHGARIFNRLVNFLRAKYVDYGFDEVITPTIYKKALWARSGHLENYADDMFTVTSMSPSRADRVEVVADDNNNNNNNNNDNSLGGGTAASAAATEEDEYGLKPMNCPGHCLVFASERRSYRDLPLRFAEFSPLHRNEISGALTGLTRLRRFHQDDGHVFCRPSQVESEIGATLDFVRAAYRDLRLGEYHLTLSTRPADHYIGSPSDWDRAEAALRRALEASGTAWTVNEGDGAFYGPKIDVIVRDSDGKEHQTATIQLDFQLPRRFGLEYQAPAPEVEEKGETTTDPALLAVSGPVRPVMIHRAVLGSVERLMALLIEHYDGRWPFWLNPRQAIVLTVNDTAPVVDWARRTQDVLLGRRGGDTTTTAKTTPSHLAIDLDDSARSLPLKVREAKSKGYGVIVVVGPKNVAARTVTVDASGIPISPANNDWNTGEKTTTTGGTGDEKKSFETSPEELLRFMKAKVDTYQ